MRLEEIKVGNYDFLHSETFVLSNAKEVSFYIADETPQRLRMTIRLTENAEEQNSIKPDENDRLHIIMLLKITPGEKIVSKEFISIGAYDSDSKPLFMSFYVTALNEVSRVMMLNFYTLKHGEDIG